jgi:prephenate dehydrogenase
MKSYQTLSSQKIKNLLLIGAGLIGGSLTLALKQAHVARHIIGVGHIKQGQRDHQ